MALDGDVAELLVPVETVVFGAADHEIDAVEGGLAGGLDRFAVEPHAAAGVGVEQLVGNRVADRRDDRPAGLDEGDRDAKLTAAAEEGAGAVDGVDQPVARADYRAARLLGHPAVIGPRPAQHSLQMIIGREVGLADPMAGTLLPGFRLVADVAQDNGAGLAYRLD